MKNIFVILSLVILCGCMSKSIPRTQITASVFGKPLSIECPKDLDADSIIAIINTNGIASIEIKGIHTRMNPEVITTTGDAQAKLIKATVDGVTSAINAATK